jgi:hypothetical protein
MMSPEEEWDLAVIMMQIHGVATEQRIAEQVGTYDREGDLDRANRFRRLATTMNQIRGEGGKDCAPSSSTSQWLPD